jgi:predicted O-linked N-acetylglucosamine transferase (SPINDLY family)
MDPTLDADLPAPKNNVLSQGMKALTANESIKNGVNALLSSMKTDENLFTSLSNFAQQALTPENMKVMGESFASLSTPTNTKK